MTGLYCFLERNCWFLIESNQGSKVWIKRGSDRPEIGTFSDQSRASQNVLKSDLKQSLVKLSLLGSLTNFGASPGSPE